MAVAVDRHRSHLIALALQIAGQMAHISLIFVQVVHLKRSLLFRQILIPETTHQVIVHQASRLHQA
jgi:hypothetical protein